MSERCIGSGKFHIYARRLFLTYSRCPDSWTKEYVKKRLVDEILIYKQGERRYKTKVRAWIVAEENHKEPIGLGEYERGVKHYHCLIEGQVKIEIKDERELDIEEVHGNYQAVENVFSVLNYVKKHGNWIGEGYPGMDTKERNILEAATEFDAKMQLMNKMRPSDQLKLREEYQKVKMEIEETTIRKIKMEAPYAFKRDLEPYI